MLTIDVRALTPADWECYRSLRLAALAESPQAFGSTLAREQAFTEETWRQRLSRRDQFAARDRSAAECGLIGLVPLPEEPGAVELVSMWVDPRFRGHGVGGALVRAALGWAEERGVREVRLRVTEGNGRAERLYARHGFLRAQAPEGAEAGTGDDEFAMCRPVDAGSLRGAGPVPG